MNLSHDGLTLRYDTPDAPAPGRQVPNAGAAALTIAVEPPNPANAVDVRYRLDGGPIRSLSAREVRTDYRRGVQYFLAKFPTTLRGERVEYCPVASCAGRQVPRYGAEDHMLSSFLLSKEEPQPKPSRDPASAAIVPRFTPGLQIVAQITVKLKPPTIIGKTPLGFRIDYYAQSGTATGNAFSAAVLENSADYMLVRPDGIGLIEVHATLRTDDQALITATYTGTIDFGEDGYERMATGNYPELPRLQISPRLMSEHPRYRWVNRTHFLGLGQVDMRALVFKYDVYAVTTLVQPSGGPSGD